MNIHTVTYVSFHTAFINQEARKDFIIITKRLPQDFLQEKIQYCQVCFPLRITITELSHRLYNDHKSTSTGFSSRRRRYCQECFLLSDNDHTNFPSIKKYTVNSCEQFFLDFLNYSLAIFTFSVYIDTVIYFSE